MMILKSFVQDTKGFRALFVEVDVKNPMGTLSVVPIPIVGWGLYEENYKTFVTAMVQSPYPSGSGRLVRVESLENFVSLLAPGEDTSHLLHKAEGIRKKIATDIKNGVGSDGDDD